jgi:hypothetical protein
MMTGCLCLGLGLGLGPGLACARSLVEALGVEREEEVLPKLG